MLLSSVLLVVLCTEHCDVCGALVMPDGLNVTDRLTFLGPLEALFGG